LERHIKDIAGQSRKAAALVISLVWLVSEILCELLRAIYLCLQQCGVRVCVCVNAKRVFIFLAATRGPVRKIDARGFYINARREFLVYINRQNRESHFI
jgi:hypothetical protein